MRLSVLDQSPIRKGGTPEQAVRESIELAKHCDRLGYHRYWVAEHHNSQGLAGASPEVLIARLAAETEHIRVGSGGVMLSHYSPLKVAEQFRMLEALTPGRIDLGVGRAPGSDRLTAGALAAGPGALGIDHYPDQLMDLYGYLTNTLPGEHPFRGIRAMPAGESMPELWLLGSSAASARYAAELGWRFSFAHFINQDGGERYMQLYRDNFEPSPVLAQPEASIGVSATVAETDEEAEHLSWSRWAWRLKTRLGLAEGGIPSPEEARSFTYSEPELDYIAYARHQSIFGSPGHVADRLLELAARYQVDELVVVTITYDFGARKRSYELLAEAFNLEPRG
jgi:luciferase family oxidoreductase group 1